MFREIIAERAVQTPDLEQINASSPLPCPDTPHALIWRRGVLTFNIKGVQQFNQFIQKWMSVVNQNTLASLCANIRMQNDTIFASPWYFHVVFPAGWRVLCSVCCPDSVYSLFYSRLTLYLSVYLSNIRPQAVSATAAQSYAWHPQPPLTTSALPRIPGDEKLSYCAHIWNLSDDKIINVEANIVSDILSQPWELSQSQFLILKAQE